MTHAPTSRIHIRPYRREDTAALAQIFFDAVHLGAAEFYTAEQRMAWGGSAPVPDVWKERLAPLDTLVAEVDGVPVGFMSLGQIGEVGLLDLAFVSPTVTGQGVAWRLHTELIILARLKGYAELTTEASLAAHAFFIRQGWKDVARQTVVREGVELLNHKMKKAL